MCTGFIFKNLQEFDFLLALNRDEEYQRLATQVSWQDQWNIYAGVDQSAGGTWFGVKPNGDFAFLTNIRRFDLYRDDRKSRGDIIPTLLNLSDSEKSEFLLKTRSEYNPFNLTWGNLEGALFFHSLNEEIMPVNDSFGVSNGGHSPIWPKVRFGLESIPPQNEITQILNLMQNNETYNDLPDTGIGKEKEKFLSSLFIKSENYGTVSTHILAIRDGEVTLHETKYRPHLEQDIKFKL
jgi:uncharacterized protein with NRDE domain